MGTKIMPKQNERDYIIWQNRSVQFYLAARVLHRQQLVGPTVFCGYQAIEALMKATLVYWDNTFVPKDVGHALAKMARMIRNKVKGGDTFECPTYFQSDKRYQEVARYPKAGKGIHMPGTFLDDFDTVFCSLVCLVPFQFNSQLGRMIDGRDVDHGHILQEGNPCYEALEEWVAPRVRKRG